ncbi:MAG: hypothetical protein Q8862_07740 [Bacteroidota bacterium]|nr:hypothetical protein [Bacteroidota bacterium]MDP4206454.1 hypothetical protein [Bacteroidota bacterium]
MKRINIFRITTGLLILVTLSGCVSKKKFLAMQDLKIKAETRVGELTDQTLRQNAYIDTLKKEFNRLKYDLSESNAVKDSKIDSLSKHLNKVNSDYSEKNAGLEDKIYAFEFEKRKLNDAINDLELKNQVLKNKMDQLTTDLNKEKENGADGSKDSELQKLNEENKSLKDILLAKEQELKALRTDLDNLKQEIAKPKQGTAKPKKK